MKTIVKIKAVRVTINVGKEQAETNPIKGMMSVAAGSVVGKIINDVLNNKERRKIDKIPESEPNEEERDTAND